MSHISPKSTYYTIFGALMVLTVITVAAAFIDIGILNFPVALAIAITKATLVILFFMHVKYSSKLTKMFVGMAFFFLIVLFGLTLTDYLSRGLHTYPAGAGGAGYAPASPEQHETPAAGPDGQEGAAEGGAAESAGH